MLSVDGLYHIALLKIKNGAKQNDSRKKEKTLCFFVTVYGYIKLKRSTNEG